MREHIGYVEIFIVYSNHTEFWAVIDGAGDHKFGNNSYNVLRYYSTDHGKVNSPVRDGIPSRGTKNPSLGWDHGKSIPRDENLVAWEGKTRRWGDNNVVCYVTVELEVCTPKWGG